MSIVIALGKNTSYYTRWVYGYISALSDEKKITSHAEFSHPLKKPNTLLENLAVMDSSGLVRRFVNGDPFTTRDGTQLPAEKQFLLMLEYPLASTKIIGKFVGRNAFTPRDWCLGYIFQEE